MTQFGALNLNSASSSPFRSTIINIINRRTERASGIGPFFALKHHSVLVSGSCVFVPVCRVVINHLVEDPESSTSLRST